MLARPRRIRETELGYLLRALRNAHADGYRAAARRPVTVELRETDAPHQPAGVDAREVMAAIAGAPAAFRDAVVAIDLLGLSYGRPRPISACPRRRWQPGCIVAAGRSRRCFFRTPKPTCPIGPLW